MDNEDVILMLAGPVKIHPRVLRAMSTPSIGHRTDQFKELNLEIRELLQYVFDTKGPVALISGSGTAGLEAMLASILGKEDKALCINNGKFGERVHEVASLYADAVRLDSPWGRAADVEAIKERLDQGGFTAIALCHNETSTAVTNPAARVGKLAADHDLLYLVDGITSVAGMEVDMEGWGIDAVVLGSQKCLAAPAGLSAVALSERGYEALREGGPYYLDLKAHVDKLEKGDTPYTPAIHLFLAFLEALRMLKEEGLEARIERTARLGRACRAAGQALGLRLFPEVKSASNTVSAFHYPEGVADPAFRTGLRENYKVVIAGGQGEIKGKVFRIGHMGICSISDLLATFAAIRGTLRKMGKPVGEDPMEAIQAFA